MLWLIGYTSIAASFYLASAVDIHRAKRRNRYSHDPADRLVLHLVGLVAALFWPAALPTLFRAAVRRLPRQHVPGRVQAWVTRLSHRRTRLAS